MEVDLVAGRSGDGLDGYSCFLDIPGRTKERWELANQGGETVFGVAPALCHVRRCRTFRSVSRVPLQSIWALLVVSVATITLPHR